MHDAISVFAAGTKRRLMIGCVSALVGIPVMVCCLALLITVGFPALDHLAAGGNGNSNLLAILGIGLVAMVGLIGIPVVMLAFFTLRRAHALDAIFTPLGLTGKFYMLFGRHYQGLFGGRQVDVYIYRGPTVEIRLQGSVQTSLLAVPKGSLPTSVGRLFDRQPVTTDDPALKLFSFFPRDKAWASKLLADSRAIAAFQTLMTFGADWAIFRRVEIQPGEVMLYLYRSHRMFGNSIDLTAAQAWLGALIELVQVAEIQEVQPASESIASPSPVSSRQARKKWSDFLVYAIVAIVFIMPLCFIAVGVIAYLVAISMG